MAESKNDWDVGYNKKNNRYVPIPGIGIKSYKEALDMCEALNKNIKDKEKKQ